MAAVACSKAAWLCFRFEDDRECTAQLPEDVGGGDTAHALLYRCVRSARAAALHGCSQKQVRPENSGMSQPCLHHHLTRTTRELSSTSFQDSVFLKYYQLKISSLSASAVR